MKNNYFRFLAAVFSVVFVQSVCKAQVSNFFSELSNSSSQHALAANDQEAGFIYHGGQVFSGFMNGLVVKTNTIGQVQWMQGFRRANYNERVLDIDASGNSVYVAGNAIDVNVLPQPFHDYGFIARLDTAGTMLWKLSVDSSRNCIMEKVIALPDGGCVAIGNSQNSFMNSQGIILRVDSNGNVLWIKGQNINGRPSASYSDIAVDNDGNFFCCGISSLFSAGSYALLVKYSASGQLLWSREYPQTNNDFTSFSQIAFHDDELVLAGGAVETDSTGSTLLSRQSIVVVDTAGLFMRGVVLFQSDTLYAGFSELKITPFHTIAASGGYYHISDTVLMQHGQLSEFNLNALSFIRGTFGPDSSMIQDFSMNSAGDVFYCGNTSYSQKLLYGAMNYGWYPGCGFEPLTLVTEPLQLTSSVKITTPRTINAWTVSFFTMTPSFSKSICVNPVGVQEENEPSLLLYPNPVTTSFTLTLEEPATHLQTIRIFNAQGQLVNALQISAGQQAVSVNTEGWCAGMYLLVTDRGKTIPFEVQQ